MKKSMNKYKLYSFKIKDWSKYVGSGIKVLESDQWILLKSLNDYLIDGWVLINKKYLTGIYREEKEILAEKVLNANKKLDNLKCPDIPLESHQLFIYFQENDIAMELSFKDNSYLYIGKVSRVLKKSIYLKLLNANGIWEEKEILIRMEFVRDIKFDTDYINSLLVYSNSLL